MWSIKTVNVKTTPLYCGVCGEKLYLTAMKDEHLGYVCPECKQYCITAEYQLSLQGMNLCAPKTS